MNHQHDSVDQAHRSNLARFFVRHRQIAWALLASMLAWGVAGYAKMPKRKDPDIPVRIGLAVCPWPGISADKVEELGGSTEETSFAFSFRCNSRMERSKSSIMRISDSQTGLTAGEGCSRPSAQPRPDYSMTLGTR